MKTIYSKEQEYNIINNTLNKQVIPSLFILFDFYTMDKSKMMNC